MWWQVIPPLAVMGGCVLVMYNGQAVIRYVMFGRPMTKCYAGYQPHSGYQKIGYIRDNYMVDRYHNQGLEALPDE